MEGKMSNFSRSRNDSVTLRPARNFQKAPFGEHIFINKPNEEMIGDYLISKNLMIQPYSVKRPCVEEVRVRMRTEQRMLNIADNKLAITRQEHCEKRKKLQEDFERVKGLVRLLRRRHIDFEQFVRENQEKRERTQRGNTRQRITLWEAKLVSLQIEMEGWAKMRKIYDTFLKQYKIYEQYLFKVVAISCGEFKNSEDVMKRYDALTEARQTCNNKLREDLIHTETQLQDLQQRNAAHKLELMGLRNRVCTLYKKYSLAHRDALVWDDTVQRVRGAVVGGQRDRAQIAAACWNLYVLMCHRQNGPVQIRKGEIEKQMISIKDSLLKGVKILSSVGKSARKRSRQY